MDIRIVPLPSGGQILLQREWTQADIEEMKPEITRSITQLLNIRFQQIKRERTHTNNETHIKKESQRVRPSTL